MAHRAKRMRLCIDVAEGQKQGTGQKFGAAFDVFVVVWGKLK